MSSYDSGGQNEQYDRTEGEITEAFALDVPFLTRSGLNAILNSIADAVLVTDARGRVTFLNPVAERLTGWTAAEARGVDSRTVFAIVNEDTRQSVESPIDRALREGDIAGLASPTILRRRDGTEVAIDDSCAPVRDESGALVGAVLVFRDMTDRRQTEQRHQVMETALRESERRFRLLVEGAIDYAMILIDLDGRIVSWNEGAKRLLGYDEAEAVGQPATIIFTPEDRAAGVPERELIKARQEGRASDVRWHQRKDGSRFWADGILERLARDGRGLIGFAKILRDRTRQHEAEAKLAKSEEQYRTLFDAIDEGFCVIEVLFDEQGRPNDYRFLEVNPAFEQQTGLVEAMGRTMREFVPDMDEVWFQRYGAVALTGEPTRFEDNAAAMGRWFDVYATRIGAPEQRRVAVLFTDITRRKKAEEEALTAHRQLLDSEARLRDTQSRLESALLAGNIATWTYDLVHNRVVADTNLARLFSVRPEDAEGGELGVYLDAIHPEDRARVSEIIAQAIANRNDYECEYRVVLADGCDRWLVARGTVERNSEGIAVSLPGVVLDITDRVEREQREHLLAEIAQETYSLTDPQEVIARVVERVGTFLKVDRCLFAEIDLSADRATIHQEYRSSDAVPPLVGTVRFSDFGDYLVSECAAGHIVAVDDVRNDSVRVPPATRDAYLAFGIASHVAVPAIYGGELVGVMAIHRVIPCHWRSEDLSLLRTLVERMWVTVENARLTRETILRAERETLLNRVGAAVRATLDTEEILQSTVSLLGQGLRADRSYFVRVDHARGTSRVSPEWYREGAGLEPLAGRVFQNSECGTYRDPEYSTNRTHILHDAEAYGAEEAEPFRAIQIRSRIRVPIEIAGQTASLSVTMAENAREWTEEEVRLLENVATLVRAALESAQVQQRERNIAYQLQEALIPSPPTDLPGLTIRGHYKPALAEASVGGDFYDVFPLSPEKTAIIVGDLSGKGLKAASEVATVRNMVRYALYADANIARAITGLDRILAGRDLLTGFATMFVGVFDRSDRTLTYVNCGQEPALIWRAAAETLDLLPPTGSVLGGFEATEEFEQEQTVLASGDRFAIFTDGLTDVGPNRKAHLNIEGVRAIFEDCCHNITVPTAPEAAQAVADCLISAVDSYGKGGMQDDIALLVGVVN